MSKYNNKVFFMVPGAFTKTIDQLDSLIYNIKDENVQVGCFYGSPFCQWNGGHYLNNSYCCDYNKLLEYKDISYRNNIPIRFTFTNRFITDEILEDKYCNKLLEIFNTGNNEITICSDKLENYIKSNYGNNYKFISSMTKIYDNIEKDKEIKKDYFLIVGDPDHNKDFDFIQKISNKDKLELLVNSPCIDNCKFKQAHYAFESILQTGLISNIHEIKYNCPNQNTNITLERQKNFNSFISIEDINNYYLPLGINHFKIEGRITNDTYWNDLMNYYLY